MLLLWMKEKEVVVCDEEGERSVQSRAMLELKYDRQQKQNTSGA